MKAKWMDDLFSRVRCTSRQTATANSRLSLLGVMPLALFLAFWPFSYFGMGGRKVQMTAGPKTPAARATVVIKATKNSNEKLDVKAKSLARPSALNPPAAAYVVWIQPAGQRPQNMGELTVGNNRHAQLKTQTPFKRFKIFVTAQNNPQATTPSGTQILVANVS
jgi:hypothetical protein